MKEFILFGGSGFIGSHMVRELKQRGVTNITIADLVEPSGSIFAGARYVPCDVRQTIPEDIVSGPAVVVNLAAVHRTPGHPDHEYYETNVNGARNVTEFCARTGSTTLWFTSSIAVYGPTEEPKHEGSGLVPNSAYGKSKLEAEGIHQAWAANDSTRKLIIVRPAVIFGRGENGNFTKLARAMKRGLFVYPGRTDTIKGCGYVEDLVGSLFFMNEQPEPTLLYNYCYPRSYTIKDICETFSKVAGFRRPLGTVPLSLMVNAARPFQLLNAMGLKNGIHPARMYKLIRSTNIVPGELVKRAYPYRTDLEEGLRRWLKDEPAGEFV
ncbi:MAG TPA: NAD(P)-dependent oxidoreductase [Geobacteraceae bacterium]